MTTGVPVATTASTSSRCTPGSSRLSTSLPSPDRAAAEQAGPVADDDDGDVGAARRGDGRAAMPTASSPVDVAARRRDVDRRHPAARARSASSKVGISRPERHLGVVREHVVDERVAAHQRLGRVGVRADHRDARVRVDAERQHAVVGQQDDRLLGEPARERAVRGRVEVDRRSGGRRRSVVVEQAELLLLRRARAARRGRRAPRRPRPARTAVGERRADRRRRSAARRRCRPSSASAAASPRSAATRVHDVQERDREVVGDDDAVEAPAARAARSVSSTRRRRRPARRRSRRTSSSPSARRRRGSPSRTAAAARRRARADPRAPARGCGRPARPSSRRSA